MKINFKGVGAFILLSAMALFYSACNKDNKPAATQPTTPTSSTQIASSQVAENIYQSLSGTYGGVNVYNGLKYPLDNSGKNLPGKNTDGCGFLIDSNINYSFNSGDTIKSKSHGSLYFYFLCDKPGKNTGFNIADSLLTTGFAPNYTFSYDVTQHFKVELLNNDYNKFEVDGSIKSLVDLVYSKPSSFTVSTHVYITLHEIILDLAKHDIVGGTASFRASGNYGPTPWSAVGTVTFIGDHKAKVTINGISFTVDLITGKIL